MGCTICDISGPHRAGSQVAANEKSPASAPAGTTVDITLVVVIVAVAVVATAGVVFVISKLVMHGQEERSGLRGSQRRAD